MWSLYKENVHPVVNLFHLASLEHFFLESSEMIFDIPSSIELAMFCIYFVAITSIDNEECQALFDDDRGHLLAKYRLGVETSLVRARFMKTDDRMVTALYVRFMLLELKLNVFKPLQNPVRFDSTRRGEPFLCSLECIETSYRLQPDRRSVKWAWFFKSYTHWPTLAFVLHELREQRAGKDAGRAWRAAEQTWHRDGKHLARTTEADIGGTLSCACGKRRGLRVVKSCGVHNKAARLLCEAAAFGLELA
ncbi:hypothetical protein CSAL01_11754 [Colletotrichum salicis]|uniref:Uncharacterized protein n=1 Tax=Colletotrichum salicis TaxID=1209931 RepID=A0A135S3U6_9PEZI|nr:hypothetical protein CSAL01_11754 [Colletotrichum salicis]